MNFDAKLPQFPAHNLQPSTIRDICIDAEIGLDLVNSDEDREEFRKLVRHQLDSYYRHSVRYAVSVMGGTRATSLKWPLLCDKVSNAWICQRMTAAV